jgi:hypothetical protein
MAENKQNTPLSTWGKMQKMFREVLIIVFGVTVSIWLANWNDKRKERAEVKEFLADIKEDLTQDTVMIHKRIRELKPYIEGYKFANNLTKSQLDSMEKVKGTIYLKFDIVPIQFNEGNYQGFKSSGKIGFIDNRDLKKQILTYHEQVLPGLKEIEKEHMGYQKVLMNTFFNDVYGNKSIKETFSDPKVKSIISNAERFGGLMIQVCEVSLQEADSLLLVVNKALK